MVVLAVGVDRFEPRDAGAYVDPLDETVSRELLEGSVDACDAGASALTAELVEDLLCGQAAMLAAEQFDHRSSGSSGAVTA
jgi:hypothetical protein